MPFANAHGHLHAIAPAAVSPDYRRWIGSDRDGPVAWRIGVDSAGTFTDICLFDEDGGHIAVWKVSSTSADPSHAVAEGIGEGLKIKDSLIERFRVRSRLFAGGNRIRTIGSGASGEADAILPVKDRPR